MALSLVRTPDGAHRVLWAQADSPLRDTQTILIFITLEKLRLLIDVAREKQGLPSARNPHPVADVADTEKRS